MAINALHGTPAFIQHEGVTGNFDAPMDFCACCSMIRKIAHQPKNSL
jgi:hypothetical protein